MVAGVDNYPGEMDADDDVPSNADAEVTIVGFRLSATKKGTFWRT